MIGAGKLSPCRIFVRSTGAVSRYNLSRSQNPDSYRDVTVQDCNCMQMREPAQSPALRDKLREGSGCKNHYEFVLSVGVKAKSMTTYRFAGQVVPRNGKQLTHIVRVMCS